MQIRDCDMRIVHNELPGWSQGVYFRNLAVCKKGQNFLRKGGEVVNAIGCYYNRFLCARISSPLACASVRDKKCLPPKEKISLMNKERTTNLSGVAPILFSLIVLPSYVSPYTLFLLHFIIVSIQSGCNTRIVQLGTSALYLPALSFVTYSIIIRSVCYKSIWSALSALLVASNWIF